ncbi:hypothetical protein [Sinorhizobium meliloti]|uniref:hypothetical protein n=1 Tax=Rhizobium meliloti TaxID=382 RepID=UPI0003FAE0F5|nr:hypothetical protein [Sinorhizobium meliloti]
MMHIVDNGGAAFPFQEKLGDGTHYHSHEGMTFRQYAAVKALAGLLANPSQMTCIEEVASKRDNSVQAVAAYVAMSYADALIRTLKETE